MERIIKITITEKKISSSINRDIKVDLDNIGGFDAIAMLEITKKKIIESINQGEKGDLSYVG